MYFEKRILLWLKKQMPFVLLGVWMLIVHLLMDVGFNDDAVYAWELDQYASLFEYLRHRYNDVNSRQIIDCAIMLIVRHPRVWKILDTGMFVLAAASLYELIPARKNSLTKWLTVGLVFIYPFVHMKSAGWIATTLNYIWVLALGLFSLIPLKRSALDEECPLWITILSVPAVIYAANHEQMCAALLAIHLLFAGYLLLRDRKYSPVLIIQLAVCILSTVHILTCPGSEARRAYEIRWFPDYYEMSVFRRFELGFSSSLYEFVMKPNPVFIAFCIVLAVSVFRNSEERKVRIIALVPGVIELVFGLMGDYFGELLPHVKFVREAMTQYGTGITAEHLSSVLPDLVLLALCASVYYSFWNVFKDKNLCGLVKYIMAVGFGTRIIMGFSPTIWASQSRTYIFMYFAIIFDTALMIAKLLEDRAETPQSDDGTDESTLREKKQTSHVILIEE